MKTVVTTLTLLILMSVALARPAQHLSFTCPEGIFATLDTYIFTNTATIHQFKLCNEPLTELTDADGNVWFIWAFIDTPDEPGIDAFCEIAAQLNHVKGECSPAVSYALSIPDVN